MEDKGICVVFQLPFRADVITSLHVFSHSTDQCSRVFFTATVARVEKKKKVMEFGVRKQGGKKFQTYVFSEDFPISSARRANWDQSGD